MVRICDDASVRHDLDPRQCENCGGEYRPERFWQRYCSKGCRVARQREERREAFRLLRARGGLAGEAQP